MRRDNEGFSRTNQVYGPVGQFAIAAEIIILKAIQYALNQSGLSQGEIYSILESESIRKNVKKNLGCWIFDNKEYVGAPQLVLETARRPTGFNKQIRNKRGEFMKKLREAYELLKSDVRENKEIFSIAEKCQQHNFIPQCYGFLIHLLEWKAMQNIENQKEESKSTNKPIQKVSESTKLNWRNSMIAGDFSIKYIASPFWDVAEIVIGSD